MKCKIYTNDVNGLASQILFVHITHTASLSSCAGALYRYSQHYWQDDHQTLLATHL